MLNLFNHQKCRQLWLILIYRDAEFDTSKIVEPDDEWQVIKNDTISYNDVYYTSVGLNNLIIQ